GDQEKSEWIKRWGSLEEKDPSGAFHAYAAVGAGDRCVSMLEKIAEARSNDVEIKMAAVWAGLRYSGAAALREWARREPYRMDLLLSAFVRYLAEEPDGP